MNLYPSEIFYTLFAKHYRAYASQRQVFLDVVDDFIKSESLPHKSIIDIGSGDGKRAKCIADIMMAKNLTLVDNSQGMISLANKVNGADILLADISNSEFKSAKKYDIVLCLWNVLGHIPSASRRLTAMINLKNLVSNGGFIFLDINNRYNISQYGFGEVVKNILKDLLMHNDCNGDFELGLNAAAGEIRTKVHLFAPFEMDQLIK